MITPTRRAARAIPIALVPLVVVAFAAAPACAQDVWAEVSGHAVDVFHQKAVYNCCWIIDAELALEQNVVDLYEIEGEGSEPCDCFCDFDLRFRFELAEPGDYLLRVWFLSTAEPPFGYQLVAELPIEIEAAGAAAQVTEREQSPCGGWAVTAVPEEPAPPHDEAASWSTVKARY